MKGITEIVLTDVRTGETERIVETNMVTDAVADLLKAVPFYYKPSEMMEHFLPLWQKAMGGVVLFDDVLEENSEKYFEPYSVNKVGYAGDGASNLTDPKRGSRNVIESEVLANGVKMVWDFTTAQANGTIKSICLTSREGGEGEYGSDAGLLFSHRRFITQNVEYSGTTNAITTGYRIISAELDAVDKIYYLYSLYQSADAITIRKLVFPLGDVSQTVGNLDFFETEGDIISIPFTNTKNLSAGSIAFTDGYDGYWYGFHAAANKTGNGSLYVIKISKEDHTLTELGDQTLSGCKLSQIRERSFHPVISDGYVYLARCADSSSSYGQYTYGVMYKVSLSNFADVTELFADQPYTSMVSNGYMALCRFPNGTVLWGDRMILPDGTCRIVQSATENRGWYPNDYHPVQPVLCFRTLMIAEITSTSSTYADIAVNPYYLATINNLPSPITKTADKTMKITYTLTYE